MNMSDNPGLLLHKIGAMMENISDKVLFQEFGIGFSQFKVLFALEHHEAIQQKEIAQFLGQTEASISRQIKLLVSAKLVSVSKATDDKKKHLITSTEHGRNVAYEAFSVLNQYYLPVLSTLSQYEQANLAVMLSKVHSALEINCTTLR